METMEIQFQFYITFSTENIYDTSFCGDTIADVCDGIGRMRRI
jgi:hypothetical protein